MNPPPDASAGTRPRFWVTLLAALGCFVIFLAVLYLAYIPQHPATVQVDLSKIPSEDRWQYTPQGRMEHLQEMRAKEHAAATSYAWLDKEKGVVQIPIERAMELTLQDINAHRKH